MAYAMTRHNITLGRVREIFSCYLRKCLYSLVRDSSIITDEGGLDDRDGCYPAPQANFFWGAAPAVAEARGGRTITGSRIEIAITKAIT